jgi:hypothetical protein
LFVSSKPKALQTATPVKQCINLLESVLLLTCF